MVEEIRKATNGNFVLGNDRFKEQISKVLGKHVQQRDRSRIKNKRGLSPITLLLRNKPIEPLSFVLRFSLKIIEETCYSIILFFTKL